jgi:hypothetical protein
MQVTEWKPTSPEGDNLVGGRTLTQRVPFTRRERTDRECQMTYLSAMNRRWPILRIAAGIVAAFTLALSLTWLVSNLVVDGLVGR